MQPKPVLGRHSIPSLVVVAGPTAVGKSRMIATAADDDVLRERLQLPTAAHAMTPGRLLKVGPPAGLGKLILHYDILRPHRRRFGSHALDPVNSILGTAESITFLTLRTTQERLVAQLDRRIALGHRPKKLHRLRPLYEDDEFVAQWYERWFGFVERFHGVTTGNYVVDVHSGYRLTPVSPLTAF
jgi:hypothetical protein